MKKFTLLFLVIFFIQIVLFSQTDLNDAFTTQAQVDSFQFTIYDYPGNQIKVIEKNNSQGKRQIVWNAESLPAGIYFCVLNINEEFITTKMIKL